MNGDALRTMFEELVDDSLEETVTYQIMNVAKNSIEAERPWEILKSIDTTKTSTAGETDATKALPTDFGEPIDLYLGSDSTPITQVPFEQQHRFAGALGYWVVDLANDVFKLFGTATETKTCNLYYKKATADIAAATEPVWPERFHPLIAYKMAEMFFAIDAGDRARTWDDKWKKHYEELRRNMVSWDTQLKLKAMRGSATNPMDLSNFPNGLI